MTVPTTMSRRALARTAVGGAVLGTITGAAFPVLALEERPTLAVIGRGDAQLLLLDSTEARALILVGAPDPALMVMLPAVMTLFRQRIDLIVAAQPDLSVAAAELTRRWSIGDAISLQSSASPVGPAIRTAVVTDGASIHMGTRIRLECVVGHRGEWSARTTSSPAAPMWAVTIRHLSGPSQETIVVAPGLSSLDAISPAGATLLVTPHLPPAPVLARIGAQALACNDDSPSLDDAEMQGRPLTRIYPQDIARFAFNDAAIQLPPWTILP